MNYLIAKITYLNAYINNDFNDTKCVQPLHVYVLVQLEVQPL